MKIKKYIPAIIVCVVVLAIATAAIVYLLLHKKDKKEEYVDIKWQSADGVELDFGTWKGSESKGLSLFLEATIEEPEELIAEICRSPLYDEKLHFTRTAPNGNWVQWFYIVKENRIFWIEVYNDGYIGMDSLLNRDAYFSYAIATYKLCVMAHCERETDDNGAPLGTNYYMWQTTLFPINMEDLKYLYGKLDGSLYEIDGDTIYVKCFAETVSENQNTGLLERSYAPSDHYYAAIFQNDDGRILVRLVNSDKKKIFDEP